MATKTLLFRYSEDDDGSSRATGKHSGNSGSVSSMFIHSAEFLANGLLVDKRCRRTSGYYPKKTEYFVRCCEEERGDTVSHGRGGHQTRHQVVQPGGGSGDEETCPSSIHSSTRIKIKQSFD
ncbi:unnamed protein product [Gadus morhua 'NCC']